MSNYIKKMMKERKSKNLRAQEHRANARFYKRHSILGNTWAIFFAIIGGRMTGKSYDITDFYLNQKRKKKDKLKVYWMRISETSTKAMLSNKADGLVDIDLVRKYNLKLTVKGDTVYDHGEELIRVFPLSKFAKLKGVAYYDKDFDGDYILILDEFQLEEGERKTSFSILYNFIGMCENLVRTTKNNIRVFLIGNTLQEASTILRAFNFLPEKFGRFYLKRKRCVIDNLEPTEEYLKDRKGSIADILGGDSMSNYTNQLTRDLDLIDKSRLKKPHTIIKFAVDPSKWYLIWDDGIITKYKGQPIKQTIAMKPYIHDLFTREGKQKIIDMFDARMLKFNSLITLSYFQGDLEEIRKIG